MSPVELLCFACIALAVLSKMIDIFIDWIENIMLKIIFLPDQIENTMKFIFIGALGYVFCWQANYSFFDYLVVINFNYVWEGWLATALILRGGSAFVEAIFKIINEKVPSFIRFGGSHSYYGSSFDTNSDGDSESTINSEYHV
jgi:hypothetical protein